MTEARSFVPAAGRDWLLPFYDPLLRLLGEERIKETLIEAADIRPGQRVLDLGCGTGTLALMIRERCPEAEVIGLDPDPKALAIARSKAERAGAAVEWRQGFADDLPFEDGSFDRVVSSLVFHHLPPDVVRAALPELRRVLEPGGSVWVLDLSHGGTHGLHGLLARFASHQHGDEDVAGQLPTLMEGAGLLAAEARPCRRTFMGPLVLTHAQAPG
ncbi:MAG: methyltransferase domain-containing protein [Deltaproteobacteria bacterium]|nr:methyltransferase domain-containing protein [Deltaproteobacteria bacterium]MBW2363123.1 methyltransferase domain-containing protein [Deltaproteobacteria bacterium]